MRMITGYWQKFRSSQANRQLLNAGQEPWTSIVHIGAGKCGSSSLQAALSNRPTFQADEGKRTFKYFSIHRQSTLNPDQIKETVGNNSMTGMPSHSFDSIFFTVKEGKRIKRSKRAKEVRDLLSSEIKLGNTPIISNEGLLHLSRNEIYQQLFRDLELKSLVFLYIRPQVELINSSWWQWGVWENIPFQQWYKRTQKGGRWNQHIKRIRDLEFVQDLHVGVCSNDVVSDFYRRLSVTIPSGVVPPRTNKSLGTEELSFLLRHRDYRPDPHSPRADFILETFPRSTFSRKAWCLRPKQIENILNTHRKGNEELLELLPTSLADEIANDPKWWSAEAYADYRFWNWNEFRSDARVEQQDQEMKQFLKANGME